jgi:hypothetical protein
MTTPPKKNREKIPPPNCPTQKKKTGPLILLSRVSSHIEKMNNYYFSKNEFVHKFEIIYIFPSSTIKL